MKHLKISCQKHKIDSLLLSSKCMTNYMKTCSFLHVHFFELMKVVENLFKKLMVKNLFFEKTYCCRYTLELTRRGNSNVYIQHMLLKIRKKTIIQVSCPLSSPLLNIPNCQSVLKFLSLYCKLFIFARQLYIEIRVHGLYS